MNPFRYERARMQRALLGSWPRSRVACSSPEERTLVDHLKLGVSQPDLLVDISHLPYDRIEPLPDGGVRHRGAGAQQRSGG